MGRVLSDDEIATLLVDLPWRFPELERAAENAGGRVELITYAAAMIDEPT